MGNEAEIRPSSDEQLMVAFVNGSESAFDELVNRYAPKITNFVYRQVAHFATAEEIAQDTFLAVFRKKHTYNPDYRFSSWVYKIAVNMCRMHFRKLKSLPATVSIEESREDGRVSLDAVLVDGSDSPVAALSRKDAEQRLQEAIVSLPLKQRQVFTLSFYEEMSYEEIARLVGCSPGTVASRKHAAVKKLAAKLRRLPAEALSSLSGAAGADVAEA
ncbi:MAG: sigma-70 family RNA polymerase sigma factor [bacterium]|nr:sigma-70 family RNA polymerase sigma factor [bacterium]